MSLDDIIIVDPVKQSTIEVIVGTIIGIPIGFFSYKEQKDIPLPIRMDNPDYFAQALFLTGVTDIVTTITTDKPLVYNIYGDVGGVFGYFTGLKLGHYIRKYYNRIRYKK